MTDPTKQPLPDTSPLAAALDAPLGGTAQPPPPATATPARTLASELHNLAMNTPTDPAKVPRDDHHGVVATHLDVRMAYLYGHRDARHAIAEALIGYPALRQPAPVAADGAGRGETRWGVRIAGKLRHDFPIARGDAERSRDELVGVGLGSGEVVPVRVTELADDAGAAGAETRTDETLAHLCDGKQYRPYPSVLCSCCRGPSTEKGQTLRDLVNLLNAADAARAAAEKERDRLRVSLGAATSAMREAAALLRDEARRAGNFSSKQLMGEQAEMLDGIAATALAAPAGGAAGRDGA